MRSLASFVFFFIVLTPSVLFAQAEPQEVWEPQVAGRFYSEHENVLKGQMNTFFKNIPKQSNKGKPLAIISPHAGYQYSGQVAAYAYNSIKGHEFTRVILLAPSHFTSGKRFRGVSILKVRNFKTPFGFIPVDQEACNYLLASTKSSSSTAPHKTTTLFASYEGAYSGEHSLETQLPFLQLSLDNFKLVPIMVGILIDDDFDQVANAIRPLIDDKTLVVVSSDFTHYGEGYGYVPFKNDIEKNIKTLDYGAFEKILSKDFHGLRAYRKETGINTCGIIPIALLLKLLPEDAYGEILNYDTSGRQFNNFSFSVSYASILFTKPPQTKAGYYVPKLNPSEKHQSFCLTSEEKAHLLSLARNTLQIYARTGISPKLTSIEHTFTPKLKEKCGVFVTLKKRGELRGCMGYIAPRMALFQGVVENTINSSSHDIRFHPVEAKEISDITIEISVLSKPKRINRPSDFLVGKEGILIRKGFASAMFLPQIAIEEGWDRVKTLCNLCLKAGLPEDSWKNDGDGMEFYIFTADVFNEANKT